MEVKLINYTQDAEDVLIFSKRTRHMRSPDDFERVKAMTPEERAEEIKYVFSTIGSSLDFVTYTFLICNATRAYTHQQVRHKGSSPLGIAFAQQTQRGGTQENFGYLMPYEFESNAELYTTCQKGMENANWFYKELLRLGAKPQDARAVLPTNVHTNILMKINLRAFSEMLHVRLCVRAQGEFQNIAKEMVKLVVGVHSFVKPILGPGCVVKKICEFPRFDGCPLKKKYPWVNGPDDSEVVKLKRDWQRLSFEHQPDLSHA